MHSADYAVARCLSVRLSVTRRYSVETAKCILKLLSPSDSSFSTPNIMANSNGDPLTAALNAWYDKIAIFDQYLVLSRI